MSFSKTLISSIVLYLIVVQFVQAFEFETRADQEQTSKTRPVAGTKMDCGAACKIRCSLSSRPNYCTRACGTCCFRCNCVPPGTSGNYEACPCYGSLTTHGNKHKCP